VDPNHQRPQRSIYNGTQKTLIGRICTDNFFELWFYHPCGSEPSVSSAFYYLNGTRTTQSKHKYRIPKYGFFTLKIFNILGEKVTTLVSGQLVAGSHSFEFDASRLASGIYLYRLSIGSLTGGAENFVQTKKMLLLR